MYIQKYDVRKRCSMKKRSQTTKTLIKLKVSIFNLKFEKTNKHRVYLYRFEKKEWDETQGIKPLNVLNRIRVIFRLVRVEEK